MALGELLGAHVLRVPRGWLHLAEGAATGIGWIVPREVCPVACRVCFATVASAELREESCEELCWGLIALWGGAAYDVCSCADTVLLVAPSMVARLSRATRADPVDASRLSARACCYSAFVSCMIAVSVRLRWCVWLRVRPWCDYASWCMKPGVRIRWRAEL